MNESRVKYANDVIDAALLVVDHAESQGRFISLDRAIELLDAEAERHWSPDLLTNVFKAIADVHAEDDSDFVDMLTRECPSCGCPVKMGNSVRVSRKRTLHAARRTENS